MTLLYKVQVGAFASRANAERLSAELKEKGYDCFIKAEESEIGPGTPSDPEQSDPAQSRPAVPEPAVPAENGNLSGKWIYLCAGHGGSDPGACGNGLQESDRALRGTQLLAPMLENLGATVLPGRTGDYYKSLSERTSEANVWGADLYISWHFNGYDDPAANGTEVLYVSNSGNALANCIVSRLVNALGTTNRGAKYQDDWEVTQSDMTAVILEPGFITNPGDAAKMADDAGMTKMAAVIAQGICDYVN